jgi:hypothetical protein
MAGVEVPASLVMTEGLVATVGEPIVGWSYDVESAKREGSMSDREMEEHLRQGAGREWIEEAAEDEQLTELLRRRRLSLGERALELVHRGQRVRAETGSQTFTGQVVYAGADFATIDRGDDLVEVVLTAATWVIEAGATGGHEQSGEPLSFKGRLAEVASTPQQVRMIVSDGRALIGAIEIVATDHIEMSQDGNTLVVPTAQIVAVIRSSARF